MKKLKTILIIGVIFAMVFTVIPSMTGDLNAYAATPKKITLKISGNTSYSVTLKWNKCKSPKKGYAVFRDGSCIKRFNTKTTSYNVSCRPGDNHTYQIKNWTSKKQYYNTKKKKWVNKKPKASQWKGKQTRYKYTYSNASNAVGVTNPRISQVFTSMSLTYMSNNQSISIPGDIVSVTSGVKFKLNAKASSGGALTYSTTNSSVAVIDSNGIVTTNSKGSANITIRQNGTKEYNPVQKTIRVDVTGKAQSINCNGNKTLNIGQKYNLDASASSGLSVTYTSNNTSIATVNSSGQVTAISSGKTSIFIRQGGNSTYAPVEKAVTITVNPADVTIKFNPNGGSGTMSNQTLIAGSGKLSLNTFTRENYTFKGWNTNESATTAKWADGATFSQIGDTPTTVTLYAIWEKNPGPITISGPFTVDIPSNMINNGENVINTTMGQVQIPMTIPEHVARIDWTVTLTGTADAYNTITHTTNNNGKTLYLKANNALNSKDNFGKLKYTGTLTMEDGYIYSGTPTVTFTITNTIYPTVGPITNKTYDFTSFNRPISNGDVRTLYVFKELPANSTININLEEFYGGYDNVKLMLPTSGWEILNKSSVVGKIISPIAHNGQIRLIKAGTFQIISTENNKTMTFVLSGNASTFINNYYNHLNSVASQCKTSNEINTIKNCLAYIYTHYTYNDNGGGMWTDGYGNCAAGNQYLTDLLNVCGIESYYRNASIERANHYNTAVILSDGTKYIVDGTPDYNATSTSVAMTYINDTMDLHSGKHSKIILWDEYDAWYDAVTISFFGY